MKRVVLRVGFAQMRLAMSDANRRWKFLTTRIMMTLGDTLRHDASHKAAKRVYCEQSRPFVGTFSVMNAMNQINGFWNCTSASLTEVRRKLPKPYERMSYTHPRVPTAQWESHARCPVGTHMGSYGPSSIALIQ